MVLPIWHQPGWHVEVPRAWLVRGDTLGPALWSLGDRQDTQDIWELIPIFHDFTLFKARSQSARRVRCSTEFGYRDRVDRIWIWNEFTGNRMAPRCQEAYCSCWCMIEVKKSLFWPIEVATEPGGVIACPAENLRYLPCWAFISDKFFAGTWRKKQILWARACWWILQFSAKMALLPKCALLAAWPFLKFRLSRFSIEKIPSVSFIVMA